MLVYVCIAIPKRVLYAKKIIIINIRYIHLTSKFIMAFSSMPMLHDERNSEQSPYQFLILFSSLDSLEVDEGHSTFAFSITSNIITFSLV